MKMVFSGCILQINPAIKFPMRFLILLLPVCALALGGCAGAGSPIAGDVTTGNTPNSPGERATHRNYNEGGSATLPASQQNGTQ